MIEQHYMCMANVTNQKTYSSYQSLAISFGVSILMLEFHDETEIRIPQVVLNPLVDAAIQFRIEMILPVSSFTFCLNIV